MTATTYREGDEDIDVIVKLRESAQNSLEDIAALRLTSALGTTVPLAGVADISVHTATTEIKRRNLDRTVIVAADADESVTTIGGLLSTVLGSGGSSAVWRPLANTIVWGLSFSTILTLVVIPRILSVIDDIKTRVGRSLVRNENSVGVNRPLAQES